MPKPKRDWNAPNKGCVRCRSGKWWKRKRKPAKKSKRAKQKRKQKRGGVKKNSNSRQKNSAPDIPIHRHPSKMKRPAEPKRARRTRRAQRPLNRAVPTKSRLVALLYPPTILFLPMTPRRWTLPFSRPGPRRRREAPPTPVLILKIKLILRTNQLAMKRHRSKK